MILQELENSRAEIRSLTETVAFAESELAEKEKEFEGFMDEANERADKLEEELEETKKELKEAREELEQPVHCSICSKLIELRS